MMEHRVVTAPRLPPLAVLRQHPFAEDVERFWARIAHAYFSTVENVLVSPLRRPDYDQVGSVYAPLFEWLIQRSVCTTDPAEWSYLRQRIEHLLAEFRLERTHAAGFDGQTVTRGAMTSRALSRRIRPADV